jgi:hypothetical protein
MAARQLLGWGLIGSGAAVMIAALVAVFIPGLGGARWLWLIGLLLAGEALCLAGVAALGPEMIARLKAMLTTPSEGKRDD